MRIWMEDSGNVPFTLIRSITEEEEEGRGRVWVARQSLQRDDDCSQMQSHVDRPCRRIGQRRSTKKGLPQHRAGKVLEGESSGCDYGEGKVEV